MYCREHDLKYKNLNGKLDYGVWLCGEGCVIHLAKEYLRGSV